jgi:cobalamin biosynthesis protein CobW
VCCKLSDALADTLEVILTEVKPDRLVLETSGVALPGEVQVQFWRPPVDAWISEEVVVVLVDAEHLARTEQLESTFVEQVEAADILLLNKVDLVDEAALVAGTKRLSEMTGGQPVLRSTQARVDPALLFPPDPDGSRVARRDPNAAIAPHVHERFTTKELNVGHIEDVDELLAHIAALNAVRAKGFVNTADGVMVVQGVGPRIELTPPMNDVPEELVGRIVIIHRLPGHD